MLTMLDLFGLICAGLTWLQRAQIRRLERVGERVPFSDELRETIERTQGIAQAEGARAVSPVHLAQAALEFRNVSSDGACSPRAQAMVPQSDLAETRSLQFTYPALVVVAEAVRVAADARRPAAMTDHLLLGIVRKRTGRATQLLASQGITLANIEVVAGSVAPSHRVSP